MMHYNCQNRFFKYFKPSIILILVLINCTLLSATTYADTSNNIKPPKVHSVQRLDTLPVLHDGRIKPLDTYSRLILKILSHKETINNKKAINWFVELLVNPNHDYTNPLFYVHNPELKDILKLSKNTNYYSFKQVLPGIKQNINLISSLETNRNKKDLVFSPSEHQLLDLYHNTLVYFDLSRSLSLLLPEFDLEAVNDALGLNLEFDTNLKVDDKISYYQLLPYKQLIAKKVDTLLKSQKNKKNINTNNSNTSLINIAKKFKEIAQDRININFKIIPDNNNLINQLNNNDWLAPWEVLNNKLGDENKKQFLINLQSMVYSYYHNDQNKWDLYSEELHKLSIAALSDSQPYNIKTESLINIEVFYNKFNPFNKSIWLYSLALMLSIIQFIIISKNNNKILKVISNNTKAIYYTALISFISAVICHSIGVAIRMYILQRPPVSNLYESILFVGIIISLLSLFIEKTRRDNLGILLGSLICSILLFIANSYAKSGDTFGVLIAVLDNNFWLGTHVVAITTGYGCCLLLSALAHLYLIQVCFNPNSSNSPKVKILNNYILALCLLSLFMTFLGTILGGIWADQSWGRFWGWDPKENGALLICLWLTSILHGKISKHLNQLAFITGAALTSITVMLAWFGVNVLGAGLHSYGFTENISLNLTLFISFELILISGLYLFARSAQTSCKGIK